MSTFNRTTILIFTLGLLLHSVPVQAGTVVKVTCYRGTCEGSCWAMVSSSLSDNLSCACSTAGTCLTTVSIKQEIFRGPDYALILEPIDPRSPSEKHSCVTRELAATLTAVMQEHFPELTTEGTVTARLIHQSITNHSEHSMQIRVSKEFLKKTLSQEPRVQKELDKVLALQEKAGPPNLECSCSSSAALGCKAERTPESATFCAGCADCSMSITWPLVKDQPKGEKCSDSSLYF